MPPRSTLACAVRAKRRPPFARIEADLSRREALGGTAAVLGMFAGFGLAPQFARAQTPGCPTVLTNCSFFDGTTLKLHAGREIVVEGGKVSAIVGAGQGPQDATRIDCGGRTVTPGLIDCHWHATLVSVTQLAALTQDIAFIHLVAGQEAGATLMRGFTTVRDTGGPVFGLKLAIDRGVLACPRIFPSGAMLSQTSGQAISACSTPCRAWRAIRPTIPGAPGLQRSPMARPKCCAAPTGS